MAARGRRAAAALFADEFEAFALGSITAQDEDTGEEVPRYFSRGTTAGKWQGPSVQASDTATRTVNVGGVERPVMVAALHVPMCAAPQVGWEYECITTGTMTPEGLLGRRFRVVNVPTKSYQTAYRLDVVEVSQPTTTEAT